MHRQQVLYLWLAEGALDTGTIAWAFHDGTKGEGPGLPDCEPPFANGVAALEDPYTCKGMNLRIIFKCIAGWVITLLVVGSSTALLTAQGAYTPEVGAC